MSEAIEDIPEQAAAVELVRTSRWPRRLLVLFGVLALALLGLWLARNQIADQIVQRQLTQLGLPATYEVETIGPDHQVLRNVVVGDPARPDFTAERVEMSGNFGTVRLDKPRLYGSLRAGKLSFGSLDKLLFTDSKEPFRLPALQLDLRDARARLDTDFGPLGIKADGKGALRDGFAGTLAATAPELALPGCRARGATLFGKLAITDERPEFSGPVRLASLACPGSGLKLADAAIALEARFTQPLDAVTASANLRTGAMALGNAKAGTAAGTLDLDWKQGALSAAYDLTGRALAAPQLAAAQLHAKGTLRGFNGFERIEADGAVDGSGIRLGTGLDSGLAAAQRSTEGSFAGGMLGQIREALARETRSNRFAGLFALRQTGKVLHLTVPRAQLTGTSGAALVSLSRVQYTAGQTLAPLVSGNFAVSGSGLPQLSGRMEQRSGGALLLRMAMPEYRGGGGRIALPELVLVQASNGAIGFQGRALLSGPLPGGSAEGLELPLDGTWSPARGLALWHGCVPVRFTRLAYANLTLERRGLTLCSGPAGSILTSDARGTRLAAGVARLDLAGTLGGTPIKLTSGPVGFAVPGTLTARQLDVALGAGGNAARFQLAGLTAQIGENLSGRFERTDARLGAVPLDLFAANGAWRYANGQLSLAEGGFRLEDREAVDRFLPLIARDAVLALKDGRITAAAMLREPTSDRAVVQADIVHNLNTGAGHSDLTVAGIKFDQQFQPEKLTPLVFGVIANGFGTVSGTGRIDWNADAVTSSGTFATRDFDFDALFGPVKGVEGTVHFTDLLGLVTAPDQRLRVASVNPGIEAQNGEISFQLKPDAVLQVNGGSWPFMDGTLRVLPTRMVIGNAETRRFTLAVEGLNAAVFVQRLELSNIMATGVFDGTMPLVFDENGGRIERGELVARAPGGNISYVGELSYQDLSPMGNFAFDALKSLDYKSMRVDLDGSLSDEIVTRVAFEGLGQGKAARQNFLTKQVAKLPIKFRVNIRAPFFTMFSSFKSLYDPSAIRDPRELGLFDKQPDTPGVQPPVSETKP